MEHQRMSIADMVQYCDEALAWEDLGPIDIMFFDTVKRIVTGEINVNDVEQEEIFDDEGFFNETETTGDYYNPDSDSSITL